MTSAAVLTGHGTAGVAVVEIFGDNAIAILERIFRPADKKTPQQRGLDSSLVLGAIWDGSDLIDHVIIATDCHAKSVHINCHGGGRIVQRLLMLLQKHGVTISTWQKLHKANSIADEIAAILPLAKTRLGVKAIAGQEPNGLTAWAKQTIEALTNCQAEKISITVENIAEDIQQLLQTHALVQRLIHPARVVLFGSANTGKSTLANALAGCEQSIATNIPGTTRDWTAQLVDIAGLPINLIDTAGNRVNNNVISDDNSRSSKSSKGSKSVDAHTAGSPHIDEIERVATDKAAQQADIANLVLLVVDASTISQAAIVQQAASLRTTINPLIVANKADLLATTSSSSNNMNRSKKQSCIYVSALRQSNLDTLRRAIANRLGFTYFNPTGPIVFTDRQRDILQKACHALTAKTGIVLAESILKTLFH